ncbi:MAG: elongation factor P hydroxylase [Natronospirillum sp.]
MQLPNPEPQHRVSDLIQLFNGLFLPHCNTVLVAGDDEPVYRPADAHYPHHRIVFAHGFFASALHEIGHWCVAGPARRLQEDFGYWYKPDGRSASEQAEFERVEVRPQAYEWIFAQAAGHPFHFSADNLASGCGPSDAFQANVKAEVQHLLSNGLAERPQLFAEALRAFYSTQPAGAFASLNQSSVEEALVHEPEMA